jgi:hypothetical protein
MENTFNDSFEKPNPPQPCYALRSGAPLCHKNCSGARRRTTALKGAQLRSTARGNSNYPEQSHGAIQPAQLLAGIALNSPVCAADAITYSDASFLKEQTQHG